MVISREPMECNIEVEECGECRGGSVPIGVKFSEEGRIKGELDGRIGIAMTAVGAMLKKVFGGREFNNKIEGESVQQVYNSVPQAALWQALEKLGVPDFTIELIKSFHQETRAKLCLNGAILDEINISNGKDAV